MDRFQNIQLAADEEIVFGPVTSTTTTSINAGPPAQFGQQQPSQPSLTHVKGRTVAITNQRILIEDTQNPAKSRTVPNDQVTSISMKRKKDALTITKVQLASGESVKVDLPGISAQREILLQQTFPNAEVSESKGSLLPLWIILGVVGAIVACCIFIIILTAVTGNIN